MSAWAMVRRFGPALLILAAVIAAFASGVTKHLTLHELAHHRQTVEAAVHAHPWLGFCIYVGAYTAIIALSLPAALVMTLTGGLLFGPWLGGLAATVSCTVGATIIFLICRTAAGDVIKQRAGPTAARIEAGVRANAFSYIVFLRLLPVAPFWLINLALGLIDIPLTTFVVASFLGILPVSLIFATIGSGLNETLALHLPLSPHLILQPKFLLPLIALSILSLGPVIWRHLRARRTS